MPTKRIEVSGVYRDMEIIQMNNGKILEWSNLSNEKDVPVIPFGTKIKITLTYDDADFLKGSNGIVWATYGQFQVETIKNALLVQNIFSEIRISDLEGKKLYLIFIQNSEEVESAIDFIWREEAGLRLKLDWQYSANNENESFNKW
ncbi:MAG: hypothetical protein KAI45_02400, partial [Melioribacteraceae bacterium]|nr:hypothetical protein [Melioribacteraceae bacterium]